MMQTVKNISLNEAQARSFSTIVEAIKGNSERKLFFLDGPAGSGKTYLYNGLIMYL